MKIFLSLYSGYDEKNFLYKFELKKSFNPPIPRVNEKIVVHNRVFVCIDVVHYFESDYEIALMVREDSSDESGDKEDPDESIRSLPEAIGDKEEEGS